MLLCTAICSSEDLVLSRRWGDVEHEPVLVFYEELDDFLREAMELWGQFVRGMVEDCWTKDDGQVYTRPSNEETLKGTIVSPRFEKG